MAKHTHMKDPAAGNPGVVLRAFAPETEFVLTLDGAMLLERLENAYVTGGKTGLRDLVICVLVMTDEDAVLAALRKGALEKLITATTAGKRPGDLLLYGEKVGAALLAAMEPTPNADSLSEKKSTSARAGGSP